MAILKTTIDTRDAAFAENAATHAWPDGRSARQGCRDRAGRRGAARERHLVARQAAAARARAHAARSRHAVPRAVASSPPTACTTAQVPAAGIITGIGRVSGPRMRDRRQRRHGQGRHLLPDDGEEAPARAGDRAAEPPALHLPGRLRRRQPAEPGRGVSRPRPFRPHLLQPGQHVGAGHPADRRA